MRWGLSVLDWRSHAINEVGEHPLGVRKAECGHLLMMVTTLHEKPSGVPRGACAALRFDHAMARFPGRSTRRAVATTNRTTNRTRRRGLPPSVTAATGG